MKVASPALAAALGAAALLPLSAVGLRGGSGGPPPKATVEVSSSSAAAATTDRRSLQTLTGAFQPLTCNTALDSATCVAWNNLFTTNEAGAVEIPCNQCVSMGEFTAGEVVTVGGLNILGRLDFPDGTKVTVNTPHVFVQGKLSMLSTSPVGGTPDVKIVMTGDADQFLVPESTNTAVCPSGGCNVGPKAIVVAGGQMDISALDDTCPTWSYVENFSNTGVPQAANGTYPTPPTPPDNCALELVETNFDDPLKGNNGLDHWTGNTGADEAVLSGSHDGSSYMKVTKRTQDSQGPLLGLRLEPHRRCLQSETQYFFSAKIKLDASADYPGHVSQCSQSGDGCLKLKYVAMFNDDSVKWRDLTAMTKAGPADGTWFDMVGSFELPEPYVNDTHIFEAFLLSGPEKEVDISVDDVRIGLASSAMFPDPNDVCTNLIINSGADELPGMTFPFFSWVKVGGMSKLEIQEENGNPFFRVPFRLTDASKSEIDTIAYRLPMGCLEPGATYELSYKVRIDSADDALPLAHIRTQKTSGVNHDRFITPGQCAPSSSSIGWVTCSGELTWQPSHTDSGNAEYVDLMLTVQGAIGANLDFDDITFNFKSGSPTGGVTLDAAVTDACYGPGTEAVVPSDEIRWDQTQEVTVASIEAGGVVNVNEAYGFRPPLTRGESADFAGQFMFLSRNVEFSGEGGSMTVLATNAVQKIQGVRIHGFGQAGVLGRNPVNFRLVSDATNSIVKKNSITESKNRCVQVQGTNNLYVGENVAYKNEGHCYALQEGSEAGNVFDRNIGASTLLSSSASLVGEPDYKDNTEVSTFWSPAPGNTWTGNVAAGSQMMGFYFRQRLTVQGDTYDTFTFPFKTSLVEFTDNVAHSSGFNGVEIMGYAPEVAQSFVGTRSYKNRGMGINVKASNRVTLEGGVVADCRNGIDVFKSDNVLITGADVYGYTALYKTYADKVQGAPKLCVPNKPESVHGIRFHVNAKVPGEPGTSVENVNFYRFGPGTGCAETIKPSSAMSFIYHAGSAPYTNQVTLSNVTFEDNTGSEDEMSLCMVEQDRGVTDIVVGDDGSLNPNGDGAAGTVVSSAVSCGGTAVDMGPKACAKYCVGDAAPAPAPAGDPAAASAYPEATPDASTMSADVASTACLRNGGFEQSSTLLNPWMALPAGGAANVAWALTTGYGGVGQSAVVHTRLNQARGGLYQKIVDTCLELDQWYELKADVRLLLEGTQTPFVCDPYTMWYTNEYSCGFMTLIYDGAEPKVRQEVASFQGPYKTENGAWNTYYGAFKATQDVIDNKANMMLMIAGAKTGVDIYVDNVVFKKVDDLSASLGAVDCASPVVNGDFESDLTGWMIRGDSMQINIGTLTEVAGADGIGSAVRHDGRPAGESRFNGILQKVPSYCFTDGSSWTVSAKFRYFDNAGNAVPCLKNSTTAEFACPAFEFEAGGGVGGARSGPLPNVDDTGDMTPGEWFPYTATFTVPTQMSGPALYAQKDTNPFWRDMWFKVSSVLQTYVYEVDDVVLTRN